MARQQPEILDQASKMRISCYCAGFEYRTIAKIGPITSGGSAEVPKRVRKTGRREFISEGKVRKRDPERSDFRVERKVRSAHERSIFRVLLRVLSPGWDKESSELAEVSRHPNGQIPCERGVRDACRGTEFRFQVP